MHLTDSNTALDETIVGLKSSLAEAEKTTLSTKEEGEASLEDMRKQMSEAVLASDAVKEDLKKRVAGYETKVQELESSLIEMNGQMEAIKTQAAAVLVATAAEESTPFKVPTAIEKRVSFPDSSSSLRHISDVVEGATPAAAAKSRRASSVFASPSASDADSRRESGLSDVLTAADDGSRRESALMEVEAQPDSIKNQGSSPAVTGAKRSSSSVDAMKSNEAEFGSSPSRVKRVRSSPAAASSQPRKERVYVCFSGVSDNVERNKLMNILSKMPNAEYLECKEGLDPRISMI
jgi:hypothetical protein